MYAIKDSVSEKLSRLFSDSPSHATDQQPRARPHSKDGKSLSSLLSFVLPSASFGRVQSTKDEEETEQVQSPALRWRSKSFSWKDKPLDRHAEIDDDYGNKEMLHFHDGGENGIAHSTDYKWKELPNAHDENEQPGSGRSFSSCSEIFEDARDRHSVESVMPNLKDDSFFISPVLYDFFQSSLPNIVKGCQWVLLYSTVRHGISLRTLIRKSSDLSGPCLLIAGDKQGAVFGGLLECPLKPTAKRKYQGTNQSFVFTTIYGEPRLFRPTGANRYFYLCLNDLLALGGGGNFALCLDGDLLTGTSGPCETFGNSCLAHDQEFDLKNVELWGFTHSSRYLT